MNFLLTRVCRCRSSVRRAGGGRSLTNCALKSRPTIALRSSTSTSPGPQSVDREARSACTEGGIGSVSAVFRRSLTSATSVRGRADSLRP